MEAPSDRVHRNQPGLKLKTGVNAHVVAGGFYQKVLALGIHRNFYVVNKQMIAYPANPSQLCGDDRDRFTRGYSQEMLCLHAAGM